MGFVLERFSLYTCVHFGLWHHNGRTKKRIEDERRWSDFRCHTGWQSEDCTTWLHYLCVRVVEIFIHIYGACMSILVMTLLFKDMKVVYGRQNTTSNHVDLSLKIHRGLLGLDLHIGVNLVLGCIRRSRLNDGITINTRRQAHSGQSDLDARPVHLDGPVDGVRQPRDELVLVLEPRAEADLLRAGAVGGVVSRDVGHLAEDEGVEGHGEGAVGA